MQTPARRPGLRGRATDHLAAVVGTRLGLFFLSDGHLDGPYLPGECVRAVDVVRNTVLAASGVGATLLGLGEDGGTRWERPVATDGAGATATAVHVDRRAGQRGAVLVGLSPPGVLRSVDGGRTFARLRGVDAGLAEASGSAAAPAAGAVRRLVTHPGRAERLFALVEPAHLLRSLDNGRTWTRLPTPEGTGDLSELAADGPDPDELWLRTSEGLYRSEDGGESWRGALGEERSLPSRFGTALVSHPGEPRTALAVPVTAPGMPVPPGGRAAVWRTSDAGRSWEELAAGLPREHAYLQVPVGGLALSPAPPHPALFGTSGGQLFASPDGGESWREVARYLPPVTCVALLP